MSVLVVLSLYVSFRIGRLFISDNNLSRAKLRIENLIKLLKIEFYNFAYFLVKV